MIRTFGFQATFLIASMSAFAGGSVTASDPADVRAQAGSAAAAMPPGYESLSPEGQAQLRKFIADLPPPLSGDQATACEIILCLAGSAGAGGKVAECVPPIRRYISIRPDRRLNFLRLCPKVTGQGDARMDRLVEIISRAPGAGEESRICSASTLNRVNRRSSGDGDYYIEDSMPSICAEYYGHDYTDLQASVPVYIGEPLRNGFWAEQEDSAEAQARYDAEQREREGSDRGIRPSAYSTL
jgi:hypothetical protein